MSVSLQARAWWKTAAFGCAVLGCALPVVARLVAGPRGADVHVEWAASVDEAMRERLVEKYRLEDPRKLKDTYTWRYDLVDPSRENIRALVNDPAIEDTHEIDRGDFVLAPTAPRTARRQRFAGWGDTIVGAADGLTIGLIVLALCGLATRTPLRELLSRGIPAMDAESVGLFRIVFGSAAVVYFATHPVDASWLADTFDLELENRPSVAVFDWLRTHPTVVDRIAPWLLITGLAFTAGAFTRLTYPLFVAGALLWGYVATSTTGIHPSGPFLITLIALLPSRWADALSVDAGRRRIRGHASLARPAGPLYGYSLWVPVLSLGVGLAAAAWAKLTVPPHWTDWVLNGTVKYHLIRDVANAPVDWGLQLAGYPWLAVLASLCVIVLEAAVITAAFTRNQWYRLVVGIAAVPLAGGFYLFMGVFWPAWWIQLLAFLPWPWLASRCRPARAPVAAPTAATRWLPATQHALIVLVIAQQLVSSSLKVDHIPIFSWYDMYSITYRSTAVWDASRDPTYRLVLSTDEGRVEIPACNPYPAFVRAFQAALEGSSAARQRIWRALQACGKNLTDVRDVTLEGDVRTFDWERLTFRVRPSAARLGPLPIGDAAAGN